MKRPYFSDLVEWVGGLWGDQSEYLTCPNHELRIPWHEDSPEHCPECGTHLVVHVPHSEELMIRWLCWVSKQKWIPQRYYVMPSRHDETREEPYRYWAFWGREWRKRTWQDWFTREMDEIEDETPLEDDPEDNMTEKENSATS